VTRPFRNRLAALLACLACRSGEVEERAPAPAAASPAPASAAAPARKVERARPVAPLAPEPWHIPVGISLPIAPGKGVGPIRFGAHLDTIERLMAEPCEQKREEGARKLVCRYSAQAVEFFLEDGGLSAVRVHRLGRPFNGSDPKPDFGIFNGRFESGVSMGMLMAAVQEVLGKPKAVRALKDANPFNTVEVHTYPLFTLEYDKQPSGEVVLGGVQLDAPKAERSKSTQRR
jgi:hypothetical protein